MKFIDLKRRIRNWDLLDIAMFKVALIMVGILIATYWTSLRGFVSQNFFIYLFLIVAVGIRPVVRYFR